MMSLLVHLRCLILLHPNLTNLLKTISALVWEKTHTFFCPKVTRLGHDRLQKLASHWKRICFHDDEMFPTKSRKTWMILGNNCSMFVSYYTLMFVHSFKTHLTSIENLINCHLFITWCMIGVISIPDEKVCLFIKTVKIWVLESWTKYPYIEIELQILSYIN